MLEISHTLVKVAALFFLSSCVTAWLPHQPIKWIRWFLLSALIANGTALFIRYYSAWPMMPMYLNGVALPFCLGGIAMGISLDLTGQKAFIFRLLVTLSTGFALVAACFPKDFYLPFLKSATVWSHLFLWFGMVGKSCFLVGALWAISALWFGKFPPKHPHQTKMEQRKKTHQDLQVSFHWTVWGFAFWTLSMFAGELWSYLGWGTPVVWDEPAITTTMATWFFYICLLHLHLTGTWSARQRGIFTAFGALLVLVLNCLPDLGPFRPLF